MSQHGGTPVRFATAAAVVFCLVTIVAAPARAQDASSVKLDAARAQVASLELKITTGEAEVERLKNRLNSLSQQVGTESVELGRVRGELAATGRKLTAVKVELDGLRERLRERARNVYMRGPTGLIGLILGSESFSDFTSRIFYASRLARRDAALMLRVRQVEAEVSKQKAAQERLESEQRTQVDSLSAQQRAVRSTFAAQLNKVTELGRLRQQANQLVAQLERELGIDLGGLRRVAGHGMTIGYGEWAHSLLATLGAPQSRSNLVAVVAWEAAEGTQATWNPLATTKDMPGATVYNSHGVKNYLSKAQGVDAVIQTLRLPNRGYEPVLASLASGADAMKTGDAIRDSLWCRGCAGGSYVVGIIPAVEEYYDRYAG